MTECGGSKVQLQVLVLLYEKTKDDMEDGGKFGHSGGWKVGDDARCKMVDVARKMHEMEFDSMVAGEFAAAASEVQVR